MLLPVRSAFAAGLVLAVCWIAGPAHAESYTLFDSPDGSSMVVGTGINAHGAVSGFSYEPRGVIAPHGFVRAADGSFTLFDPKHSPGTEVDVINDRGWVAGTYLSADGHHDAFIRKASGKLIKIPAPAGQDLHVTALNNLGDICGYATIGNHFYGFLRTSDGAFIPIDDNRPESFCFGINDSGTATGYFITAGTVQGYVRTADGSITTFDMPNGGPAFPMSINAAGDVAGTDYYHHVFVRMADGKFRTFIAPAAGLIISATINANGTVAGTLFKESYHSQAWHGFMAQPGKGMILFDAPGFPGSTWANGINDKGDITGLVAGNDGHGHGFIRKP